MIGAVEMLARGGTGNEELVVPLENGDQLHVGRIELLAKRSQQLFAVPFGICGVKT